MTEEASFGKRFRDYRPSKIVWFCSCVASVAVTMALGFIGGGWVTAGTAAAMSSEAAQKARAELAARYCVSKFEGAPDAAAKLAALKSTDFWRRQDFIKDGGWTKLPGLKRPVDGAADLCAQQLMNATLAPAKSAATSG